MSIEAPQSGISDTAEQMREHVLAQLISVAIEATGVEARRPHQQARSAVRVLNAAIDALAAPGTLEGEAMFELAKSNASAIRVARSLLHDAYGALGSPRAALPQVRRRKDE